MSSLSILLLLAPHIAFRRAAMKHLATSVLTHDAAQIWQQTLVLHSELRNTRPQHSFGVDHFLRFMEWDSALYRALLEHGITQERASRLIEDINWEVFGAGTSIGFHFTRLRSGRLQARVQTVLDLMFAMLFTKPFRKHDVASQDGIAFDVVACPIAEYFRQQGLPELTRFAACNLDHRMAQVWGVTLERSQTLAAGDARCDFRFKIPTNQS